MTSPRSTFLRLSISSLALGLLVVTLMGCEEDVISVSGTNRAFSLYGVISPQLDTQWVRVYPIEGVLEESKPEKLDATFESQDMVTGETRVWQDSILQEESGLYAHVFWSPFAAEYDHTYQIDVVNNIGSRSSVEASVPPFAELELQEARTAPATHPILITAQVPRLFRVTVTYFFEFRDKVTPNVRARFVSFDYNGRAEPVEGGLLIDVRLWEDYAEIRKRLLAELQLDTNFGLQLEDIHIGMIVSNSDWDPPGDEFDPELLVQPGVFSNVENGFGFVAAGYRLDLNWLPPGEVIEASGFREKPGGGIED